MGLLLAYAQATALDYVAPYVGEFEYNSYRCGESGHYLQWFSGEQQAIDTGLLDYTYTGEICSYELTFDSGWGTPEDPVETGCYGVAPYPVLFQNTDIEVYGGRGQQYVFVYSLLWDPPCSGDFGPDGLNVFRRRDVHCPHGYGWNAATMRCERWSNPLPEKNNDTCPAGENGTNPIHSAYGTKLQRETDFDMPGSPLRMERYYTSAPYNPNGYTVNWTSGSMGRQWRHSYERAVHYYSTPAVSTAYLQRHDGNVIPFNEQVDGSFASDPDVLLMLERVVDSGGSTEAWIVETERNEREVYGPSGKLLRIEYPDGNVLSLEYDGERLLRVSDASGRSISFGYHDESLEIYGRSDLVREIVLPDGGSVLYAYAPAMNHLGYTGVISSATYPSGAVKQYLYGEFEPYPKDYQLTGIVDENGDRYATWKYDSIGRAILSVHGEVDDFIDRYELTYNGFIVNDPNAVTTVKHWVNAETGIYKSRNYSFTTIFGTVRISSVDAPCASCGNAAEHTYDANGFPDLSVDFRGNTTDYDYNARGQEIQRREGVAAGNVMERLRQTEWHSDFNVPVQRSTYNAGNVLESRTQWVYNLSGQAIARCEIDPNDAGAMAYACSATTAPPAGAKVQRWVTTYCEQADVTAGTCPRVGLTTSTNGPRSSIDPGMGGLDDLTTYTYYPNDVVTCATGGACPHRRGDLWKITNALGHVTEYVAYDKAGRVKRTKDANGTTTDFIYHARGWLTDRIVRESASGTPSLADAALHIDYDAVGNVTRVTQPDASYLEYTYDDAHRLVEIADNLGNTIDYCPGGPGSADCLDAAGNRRIEQVRDPSNDVKRQLRRTYNQLSQLTQVLNATSQVVETSVGLNATGVIDGYDGNGNRVLNDDALGTRTQQDYDPLNRLKATIQDVSGTDPSTADATTQYAYDARDNLRQVTDPDGLPTVYDYDGLNHLTGLHSPDTGDTAYTYDVAGNRISQTDARGVTSTYTYDALNRLTSVAYPDADLDIAYAYDGADATTGCSGSHSKGRLTTMGDFWGATHYCYDRRGNVTKKIYHEKGKTAQITLYSYTLADRLASILYPSGARVTYARDALGRVQGVAWQPTILTPTTTLIASTTYAPFGPLTSITYGNGRTQARTYDQNYAIDAISGTPAGALTLDFEVDVMGNIVEASDSLSPVTPDRVYTYDPMYRLTKAETGATPPASLEAYTYNPTGDRLSASLDGNPADTYAYVPNTHRLASVGATARTYDDNGNTLTGLPSGYTLTYDDRNRLRQATKPPTNSATYRYNGKSERVAKVFSNGLFATFTAFAYDEGGKLLGEYDDAGDVLAEYVYLDEIPIAVIKDGAPYYIEADHLGTPRQVVEPANNTALWKWELLESAFGANSPNEDPDGDTTVFTLSLRFPGQYQDAETGLNYNYFRDYEPRTGRYPQSDPLGLGGGVSTYAYVRGNPLFLFDRFGLMAGTSGFNADDERRIIDANEEAIRILEKCSCSDCSSKQESSGHCISDFKKMEVIAELRSAYYVYSPSNPNNFCAERQGGNTLIYPVLLAIPTTCCPLPAVLAHEAGHHAGLDHPAIYWYQELCFGCSKTRH